MVYSYFSKSLLTWHKRHNVRKMPWKGEKNPYKIWLSEIILQQTRVEQGLRYYEDFIKSFPDIKTLATASQKAVYKKWEGLGYYSRCKNLIATAKKINSDFKGVFPTDYKEILSLKGVGPYTAAAIASFAFNQPYAVVDGNVKRVLARFFEIETPIDTTVGNKIIHQLAARLLPAKYPAIFNQAIMDFGATVCKPLKPECPTCPLRKKCGAYSHGKTTILPQKSKNIDIRNRYFNYIVVNSGNKILLKKRTEKDIWENLYEPLLIEDNRILKLKEIQQHRIFQKYFDSGEMEVMDMSEPVIQKLTHQKIITQFISIRLHSRIKQLAGYKPVGISALADYAFPKIVRTFFKDKGIPLNLNL